LGIWQGYRFLQQLVANLPAMEHRRLGGLEISRLGLGTMTWGRDTDENEAAQQLQHFFESGGNLIDTAAVYGDGDAERVLGGFIGTLIKRDDAIIATKAGISVTDGVRKISNSRNDLISDLDRSLSRLNVDYVDLWQIHTWDKLTPLEESLSALDYAVTSGKARYVGLCNFNGWQLARSATLQNPLFGKSAITSTQNEYSLLNRKVEEEVIPAAVSMDIGFFAWSPLGRGVLTGKYRNGVPSDSRGASPHFANFVEPYFSDKSKKIVEAVCVAAEGLGFSPLEVALSWVRDAPGVTSTLIGARTGAQLRGILTVEQITLPEQVRIALNEVSL
jgi:aryl-alcohol dehydrogenase-like predicted oxidoreductase